MLFFQRKQLTFFSISGYNLDLLTPKELAKAMLVLTSAQTFSREVPSVTQGLLHCSSCKLSSTPHCVLVESCQQQREGGKPRAG